MGAGDTCFCVLEVGEPILFPGSERDLLVKQQPDAYFYLFMVYLTTRSVAQTLYRRVIGLMGI
jgi:hypothetical protein